VVGEAGRVIIEWVRARAREGTGASVKRFQWCTLELEEEEQLLRVGARSIFMAQEDEVRTHSCAQMFAAIFISILFICFIKKIKL
jgi:hypothetical protein